MSWKRDNAIHVKWIDNNSDRFDGVLHWVPRNIITTNSPLKLHETIYAKYSGKLWKGLIVEPVQNSKKRQKKTVSFINKDYTHALSGLFFCEPSSWNRKN